MAAAALSRPHFYIADLCEILERYLGQPEVAEVYRAYLFSAEAHEGQSRRSGEPYIHHPLEVARLLAELHLDSKSIIAAILHDVIEDTATAKEQLAGDFGKDVAELVDGVSKIGQIRFRTKEEEQAENFRKMLLAMAQDIRVILIKLADRLHNMRTLAALPSGKQQAIARETLDIYAPIANRLGLRRWAVELEDLAFANLHPLRHRILAEALKKRQGNRRAIVDKVCAAIGKQLAHEGIEAEVSGREKNLYGLYAKMRQKGLPFERVYDIYGFRIIVDKVDTCYRALGAIHGLYKPIPGRFKDYIAIPKANGYQSLHTVVFGPAGITLEVQIRTVDMHRVAEAGVAAHWLYKLGDASVHKHALQWLQGLMEIQQQTGSPHEFLEHLKVDLFPDEVYVFTPQGDIKKLPRGATVLDFAYDVHTDVGKRCVGARVNHQLVPLRTVLRNGDTVEIITSSWSTPHPSWLGYVVTSRARAHIRNYLKNLQRDEAVHLGQRLLARALQDIGFAGQEVADEQKQALLQALRLKTWDDLLGEIGLGNRVPALVARQLLTGVQDVSQKSGAALGNRVSQIFSRLLHIGPSQKTGTTLAIRGTEGVVVTYARCCRPIPGDSILGFLSAGRGIVIHTQDCRNVTEYRKHPDKWVDVRWEEKIERNFPVGIRVEARNERGVLASVAAAIAELDANIDAVSLDEREGQNALIDLTIEVHDRKHLAQIMRHVRSKESVVRISRRRG